MSLTTTQSRPFSRAVRRIRVAAAVSSLAKSWQTWANEHTSKQDTIPSGWIPDSIIEQAKEKENERSEVKLLVTPRVFATNGEDDGGSRIKTCLVSKTITPKHSESSQESVNSIKEKIHTNQLAPEEPRNCLNKSPTIRRHCVGKAAALTTSLKKRGEKSMSRSSSTETEDSGLGEDASLSDNSDQSELEQKIPISRAKIKVTTMDDLKNKWKMFAEQHTEGQKLNPFSEDFDYDHAMATRLRKGDAGYGRPKEGSRTAQRADRAQKHIRREMDEMCFIIRDMGTRDKQGCVYVTFGRLFDRYVKISDKVVGILLRCRKHKMVDFEGEMLWQGRDDDVIITLLV
ncbi:actin-binding Rho-activating protein [Brachyhypopomus gauderio]|uniref:actin-binding Rho-activating protein n=1 Tax=Brachyhypopomus gauderio TaxID=698409 RepID=UPI00404114F1